MADVQVRLALGAQVPLSRFAATALTLATLAEKGEHAAIRDLVAYVRGGEGAELNPDSRQVLQDSGLLKEGDFVHEDTALLLPYIVTVVGAKVYVYNIMRTPEAHQHLVETVNSLDKLELSCLYAQIYYHQSFLSYTFRSKVEGYLVEGFPLPDLTLEIIRQYYERVNQP